MNEPTPHQRETIDPALPASDAPSLWGTEGPRTDEPKPAPSTSPSGDADIPDVKTVAFSEDGEEKVSLSAFPQAIPGYEILGVLGRGGMGVVYKARETALDRLVALKVVTAGAHASPEQLARFRAEARAEARLQHPNIVQVHAVGEHDGFPFLSLEYMDGGSLAQKILHHPQPPREAAHLLCLLARAMSYAHQRGIVHRDLKPANILLNQEGITAENTDNTEKKRGTKESTLTDGKEESHESSLSTLRVFGTSRGDSPIVKIADFGLAKSLEDDSGHTRTGNLMGTPNYMSPEQADGRKDIGPATDIWALGVILYELLVGRTPFQGVTMVDTLEQARTREPVPPTLLQPKVPTDLETICLKCLRKEPSQRYRNADELAEDLRRCLDGEPILARPIGSLERGVRWCRRNPRMATLSASVVLLLATIAVVSTAFVFILDARRREIVEAWRQSENNAQFARSQEERANEHAREAFERYQLLHEALTVVIDRVQRDLRTIPATSGVRRDILEAAMRVLQRSVTQSRDSTRLPERSLAAANMIMGDILLEQNKTEEAIRHYDECHDILKVLYLAQPENDKAAGNYAAALSRRADMALDYRKDANEALMLYRQALALQVKTLENPSESPELTPTEIRRSIANSHQRIGEILIRTQPNALTEAREQFRKARAYLELVVPAEDSLGNYVRVEQVNLKLAQLCERLDAPDEARVAYVRSLEALKKLIEKDPTNQQRQIDSVRRSGTIGDSYLFAGQPSDAQRYYRESVAANEQLVSRDNQPGLRVLLSLNYYRLATSFLRLDDNVNADKFYRKCLNERVVLQQRHPDNLNLQIDLMIAQGRCGLHREAAAFARELRERFPNDPTKLLHTACGYALCAFGAEHGKKEDLLSADERRLRKEYRDRALEALRQAKTKGYKDVKNLRIEPDLDPLRSDNEFQSLLREFDAGSPKP